MRNTLYAIGISLFIGTTLTVGFLVYRTIKQVTEAKVWAEQQMAKDAAQSVGWPMNQ